MLSCLEASVPSYAYRVLEEGVADGLRLGDLSDEARAQLDGMIPPEAEEVASPAAATAEAPAPAAPPSPALLTDPMPPLWVKPTQQAVEFDCRRGGPSATDNLAAAWAAIADADRPVLLKGVGSHWPALSSWTLDALRSSLSRGMVRVSPSPRVTFCRESHPDVRSGKLTPPSRALIMDVAEFIDRLHAGRGGRPPLLYCAEGDQERCYLQALAPHALMRDVISASPQPPATRARA